MAWGRDSPSAFQGQASPTPGQAVPEMTVALCPRSPGRRGSGLDTVPSPLEMNEASSAPVSDSPDVRGSLISPRGALCTVFGGTDYTCTLRLGGGGTAPQRGHQDALRAVQVETGGPKGSWGVRFSVLVPWESAPPPTLKKTGKPPLCAKDSSDTEPCHPALSRGQHPTPRPLGGPSLGMPLPLGGKSTVFFCKAPGKGPNFKKQAPGPS